MQKQNYNLMMKQQISNLVGKPKLLLHVCCAPCSSGVLPKLKEYFDITLFYYNPNTYPKDEYILRAEQFNKLTDLPLVVCDYEHSEFLNEIKGFEQSPEGGDRCQKCIALRMKQSFEYALTNNYDYVTTSLSISPHKDAEFINACGKKMEQQYNVAYLYADFKKENGYLNSISESKKFDLYRQDYCGCEFSMYKDRVE
jgi:predicted adenine nucleotide alpha hydrolase (AANH) superfamily ATPase